MSVLSQAFNTLRTEGPTRAFWHTAKLMSNRMNPFAVVPLATVYRADVIAADWTIPKHFNAAIVPPRDGGFRIAWIISPPGRTSGGHQNAFRFMEFLERAGHQLSVYLYAPQDFQVVNVEKVRQMMAESTAYPNLAAEFQVYDPELGLAEGFDAIFAADWEATYASYNYPGPAKRFYFTQDFEPWFFSSGSDYVLAENSYRLGFHGFSAGRWLAEKLTREYGMTGDYYDYGADSSVYFPTHTGPRSEVLFYARPPTPRRATEFGLLALAAFHRLRPETTINLVGWDMSGYDVPFPYVNHAALDISELNEIYNRCAAGLALSLTNMSLLPMEIMSSGVVPVVNDAENTRGVFDSPYIEYVPMSPEAIARRIIEILDRPDAIEHSATISRSVAETKWANPEETFIQAFDRAMGTSIGA